MPRLLRSLVAASAALGLLAACGGGDDDATIATDTTATMPAPAPAPTTATADLRVTEVDLGRAMRGDTAVVEEIDDFGVRDTIHAVVRHEGTAQGVTLTARWTFQDGQVVDERQETVSGTAGRPGYTHFMISKPTAWPAGNYKLSILVNGQQVEDEDFEIKQ